MAIGIAPPIQLDLGIKLYIISVSIMSTASAANFLASDVSQISAQIYLTFAWDDSNRPSKTNSNAALLLHSTHIYYISHVWIMNIGSRPFNLVLRRKTKIDKIAQSNQVFRINLKLIAQKFLRRFLRFILIAAATLLPRILSLQPISPHLQNTRKYSQLR